MLNTPDPFKGDSSERIRVELEKCFKYQNASLIHEKLKQYGLLRGVFESEKPRFDLNLDVHELDLAEYCFFMCFVKKSWPIPFTKEEWAYLCWLEYCQSFSFKNDESIKKVVLNRNFFAFIKKLQAKNWGSHEFLKMKDKLLELNLDQKNAAWLIKENFLDEKDPSQIPKNKLKLVKKTFN